MQSKPSITVNRPRDEVQRLWQSSPVRPQDIDDAAVTFTTAPGDRGTEIHVRIEHDAPAGKVGEMVLKLTGNEPVAKVKDALRRFKQLVETGEIARSDAVPEGEQLEHKLKQRPAQPLDDHELEKVGV
jgi:uncharacterized membrane protein